MRYLTVGTVVWCLLSVPAGAQTQDAQLMAPIKKFVDSFNKGDMAGAAATHAADADLAITDEVPPFLWRGAQAFKSWSTDLDADAIVLGAKGRGALLTAILGSVVSAVLATSTVPVVVVNPHAAQP